jgi:hypothetical protein
MGKDIVPAGASADKYMGYSHAHVGRMIPALTSPQPIQIGRVVFLGKAAGLAVMATLRDVQRYTIKMNARGVGQVWGLYPAPFNCGLIAARFLPMRIR